MAIEKTTTYKIPGKIKLLPKNEIENLSLEERSDRIKMIQKRIKEVFIEIKSEKKEENKKILRKRYARLKEQIGFLEDSPEKREQVKKAERKTKRKILTTIAAAIGITLAFYGYQKANREGGEGQDFLDSLKNRIENVLDTTETEENSKTLPDSAEVNAAKAKEFQ